MYSLCISLLLIAFHLDVSESQIYRHSSTGDYHVEWKEFGPCPSDKRGTNEIFTDIRLTKKRRKTEVVGNYTLRVPLDDNISINANFAILGSNSGWLPNAYSLPIPKACSTQLTLLKQGWVDFLKSMNMSTKCPIPKGVYEQKGYDVTNFIQSESLPKHFIYGRYKIMIEYINKNRVKIGCTYIVINVVPLWQKNKEEA